MIEEKILCELEDCVNKASHVMNGLLENYDLDLNCPTKDDDYKLAFNRNNILVDMRITNDYIRKAQETLVKMAGGATA